MQKITKIGYNAGFKGIATIKTGINILIYNILQKNRIEVGKEFILR